MIIRLTFTFAIIAMTTVNSIADDRHSRLTFIDNSEADLSLKENAYLPIFRIKSDFNKIKNAYPLSYHEYKYKKVASANMFQLPVTNGRVILTEWNGLLHEVNYQTPQPDREIRLRKLKYLFSSYQKGFQWTETIDNGFGAFFDASDGSIFGMCGPIRMIRSRL